ncbi:MAG: lysine transporter LysE [Rhodobacterales bacterium]|nr:MAG: lysine transporter LysE [Rhodobacterales bacterium]
MIRILLKGAAFGIAVAAPVGPIALLCIKRTLERGWPAGVASGFGVATADATYGVMVVAGLSATGLLLAWSTAMQGAGGLLIALIGLHRLRPGRRNTHAKPPAARTGGLIGAFASAYALTITNPLTILAFTALLSSLGATAQPGAGYLLVTGVFLGSLGWWIALASATALTRRKLPLKAIRWLDLATGALLLTWGLWIARAALSAPA